MPRPPARGSGGGTLTFLIAAFFLFTLLAVVTLRVPGVAVAGQEPSLRRSVFAAINATTLTGFQQDVASTTTAADVLRLVLTLGGTMFALTAGGMMVTRIAGMNYSDGQVAWGAAVATISATIAGAAFLIGTERSLLAALLQAASAFGNSGVYTGALPGTFDWRTHAVFLPLAFLGALGLPVLMEMFERVTGGARKLSTHSRTVLTLAAALYLLGVGGIALADALASGARHAHAGGDWRYALALASMFAIDARTAGLPFEYASALSRPAQWVVVALMIVGGAPGGTAGGLKTTTVWRLVTGVRDNLRGRYVSRSLGVAASWAAMYFAITLIGFLLLLRTEPDMHADRLLFMAFSATSNVGLSHDPVSITGDGLFTLSALMLAGRLVPLGILWWMAAKTDADEDAVAVG